MLANDHANVTLSSLVYGPNENNLLIAAFTVATSVELIAAIKAQLEKHGKNGCVPLTSPACPRHGNHAVRNAAKQTALEYSVFSRK